MGTITVLRTDADRFIDAQVEQCPAIAPLRALLPPPTDHAGLKIRSIFADLLDQSPSLDKVSLQEAVSLLSETNPEAELAAMFARHEDRDLYGLWVQLWERCETEEILTIVRTMSGMTARLYRASREKRSAH